MNGWNTVLALLESTPDTVLPQSERALLWGLVSTVLLALVSLAVWIVRAVITGKLITAPEMTRTYKDRDAWHAAHDVRAEQMQELMPLLHTLEPLLRTLAEQSERNSRANFPS